MEANSTIWLKPKPTHIDENFENFLYYLKSCTDKDSLYLESINLLKQRVDILTHERLNTPSYRHLTDIAALQFNVRLCGAWLLCIKDESYNKRKLVLLTLINNLIQICLLSNKSIGTIETTTSKSIDPLLNMAMSLVACKLPGNLILAWNDIVQPDYTKGSQRLSKSADDVPIWSVDKFLVNFLRNEFIVNEDALFEKQGSIIMKDGSIKIVPLPYEHFTNPALKKSLVESPLIPAWNLSIFSDKDYAIKDSRKNDVETIECCIDCIVDQLHKCPETPASKNLKDYSDRDSVQLEVVEVRPASITVRSIDPEYNEITGKLVFENSLYLFKKNYPFELWKDALPVGTRICATYIKKSQTFSFTEQFIEYIQDTLEVGQERLCKIYRNVQPEEGFYEFVSDDGYIFFVPLSPEQEDELGDDCYIWAKVYEFNEEKKKRGCIKASFVSKVEDPEEFISEEAIDSLIYDFVDHIGKDIPLEDNEKLNIIDSNIIKEACYALNVIQSRESNPSKRYKLLSVLKLIGEIAHFKKESQYSSYLSKYIKTLILFGQSDKDENQCIKSIVVPDELEDNETINSGTEILNILSYFSKEYSNEVNQALAEYIESDNELVSKTASLVQSYNRLKDLLEEKTLKGIKRRILEGLSLVLDGDSSLDLSNKQEVNFGEEDDTKEFKYSFFFPPTNAKETRQEYTVCKAICGLMNNRGGTVYLGVAEDQAGLGRPAGLDHDLKELAKRHNKRTSLDDYEVHINRIGEYWFGETAWSYVKIKQDLEYNILKINVDPYPYDVVYLTDKKAYLRKNNSTSEIKDESTIQDIRRRRQEALRKIDDKLINLQDAIQKELKVRLCGYQSSNSEKTTNRLIEPFCIEDNKYVIGYEPSEGKVKMFRISRIGSVKVTEENWTNKSWHRKPFIDIFNMAEDESLGKGRINIKLRLGLSAKNALCETYPKAKACLTPETTNPYPKTQTPPTPETTETWLFQAEITSLTPLMHFYFNYAPSIEIIEAPGLLPELNSYITAHLPH